MSIDISRNKLIELLASGAETANLDFKETADFDDRASTIEMVKDIGAMMD